MFVDNLFHCEVVDCDGTFHVRVKCKLYVVVGAGWLHRVVVTRHIHLVLCFPVTNTSVLNNKY